MQRSEMPLSVLRRNTSFRKVVQSHEGILLKNHRADVKAFLYLWCGSTISSVSCAAFSLPLVRGHTP